MTAGHDCPLILYFPLDPYQSSRISEAVANDMKVETPAARVTSFQTTSMESSATLGGIREEEGGDSTLPDDLVVEILARLPVKSLLRFRSVSKHWHSLVVSPNFIALHSTHSQRKKKVTLLFYDTSNLERPPETTLSFGFGDVTERLTFSDRDGRVDIVGCSNGVVCLSLWPQPHKYVLWNPATRQVREIGNSPMVMVHECSSGFCLDPVTNAIKVVHIRLDTTEGERETRAEFNVFSTATNSWTDKENITVPYPIWLSGCHTRIIHTAACVDGYMLWHIDIYRRKPGPTMSYELEDMYILCYDMNGEVFKRIEIPFRSASVRYYLAAYDRSLAVFVREYTGSNVDVWVLNDCSGANQSWSQLLTCRPSVKVFNIVGFFRKYNVDLILFRKDPDCSLYLYDPENGETKEFGKRAYGMHTFLYSEGLASLGQPE